MARPSYCDRLSSDRTRVVAAFVAAVLAALSAAVSLYWVCGGTALLATVGGPLERLARERTAGALLVGLITVLVKLLGLLLAVWLLARPLMMKSWLIRLTFWAGLATFAYGLLLTSVGLLALTGVVDAEGADRHALAWHAFFWDPWFVLWGGSLAAAARVVRRLSGQEHVRVEDARRIQR